MNLEQLNREYNRECELKRKHEHLNITARAGLKAG